MMDDEDSWISTTLLSHGIGRHENSTSVSLGVLPPGTSKKQRTSLFKAPLVVHLVTPSFKERCAGRAAWPLSPSGASQNQHARLGVLYDPDFEFRGARRQEAADSEGQ